MTKKIGLLVVFVLTMSLILAGCGNFVDMGSSYTVSGKITDEEGQPMVGVVLAFSGFGDSTTDHKGEWSKTGLKDTVTVTPAKTGYTFTPASRQVNQRASNINFTGAKSGFTVMVSASDGGKVKKTPEKVFYANGETVKNQAVANEGFDFVNWSGDYTGTEDTFTITVNGDKQFAATFEKSAQTVTIGTNYWTEEGNGLGDLVVGTDGTIWLRTHGQIYQYSLNKKYIGKVQNEIDLFFAGVDGVYGIDAVQIPSLAEEANYRVYQLDTSEGLQELGEVTLGGPLYDGMQLVADGEAIFLVNLLPETEGSETVLEIQHGAIDSDIYEKIAIPLEEKAVEGRSSAMDAKNLYVLLWLESGQKLIYRIDRETLTVQQRYELPNEMQLEPRGLIKGDNSLYLYDSTGLARVEVQDEGIVGEVAQKYFAVEQVVSAFPYGEGVLFSGWMEDVPGIYYFDFTNDSIEPIYQSQMRDDYLYETETVEAFGNLVYIPCRQTLKVFENGTYKSAISLEIIVTDLAVNDSGVIACVSSTGELEVITDGSSKKQYVGTTASGIDADQDGIFVLRDREKGLDRVRLFDPHKETFADLFTLENLNVDTKGITALADGNLILGWGTELRMYNRSGELLSSTKPDALQPIIAVEYSPYFGKIVVLQRTELSFVDPETLQVTPVMQLDALTGAASGLAVTKEGVIYVSLRDNVVYQITGIERPEVAQKPVKE